MGRLRVRDETNVRWIDVCQSEFYVRNAANTAWYRLLPARGLYARHGGNNYWIQIGCTTDDPAGICPDEYGGTPDGNGENGSGPGETTGGNGSTNGGTPVDTSGPGNNGNTSGDLNTGGPDTFNPNAPYKPGYGLPEGTGSGTEDGSSDSNVVDTGNGLVILTPDGSAETLDPGPDGSGGQGGGGGGLSSDGHNGTHGDPYKCPATATGRGYTISEFYVDMGAVSGTVRINAYVSSGAASVDVYFGGKRVATSGGQKSGRYQIRFEYNVAAAGGDHRIFVRVRGNSNARWNVNFQCPTTVVDDGYGTPAKPATCRGTFSPTNGGGAGIHENTHTLGKSGHVVIEYQMWYQPDRMDVVYQGRVIASTNTYISGTGTLEFNFVANGADTDVVIRISSLDGTTSWTYLMTCPDEKGSSRVPKLCGADSATTSGGAGVTDTYYDLSAQLDGAMAVHYQMWNIPDSCEVYQNGTLLAKTSTAVSNEGYLRFNYVGASGTEIRVRINGPDNATSWSFLVDCPSSTPKINAGDVSVREGSASQVSQMCFPVTLTNPTSNPVTVSYSTSSTDASGVVANGVVLATDPMANPFVAVVDTPGVGRVAFDGGFVKFTNHRWVEPVAQPTSDSVFNSWNRTANGAWYVDNVSTPGSSQAKDWTYASSDNSITATANSTEYIAFLAPVEQSSYSYNVTIGSPNADDDTIGVVVAFERVGSVNYSIIACRQQGGTYASNGAAMDASFSGVKNWFLAYLVDGTPTTLIQHKDVGVTANAWSGKYTSLRVERDGNTINVYCSPFNSTTIDRSASVLTVDLTSSPNYTKFQGTSKYGFIAHSQQGAFFKDINFEGIGLEPAFTYLKNAVQWLANPAKAAPKKVLVLSDAPLGSPYTLDAAAWGYGVYVKRTIEELGYVVTQRTLQEAPTWLSADTIQISELNQYACIVFFGSNSNNTNLLSAASTQNIAQYVSDGGGLFLITDHDVFQKTVNPIASKFNVAFYGNIDRSPVPVDTIITQHGNHPFWAGLAGKSIYSIASEGGIAITTTVSDYVPKSGTIVFAPFETSKTVCIDINGDDVIEADEHITLTLSNPINGDINTAVGTGTIINDDNPLCRQNPTLPVYETGGGPNGSYCLYVQSNFNCAAGNTVYMMTRDLTFANSGIHVFSFLCDDDYELYIDCKLVSSGAIGAIRTVSLNVTAGLHYLILRYRNLPACTPSYVGMSIHYNGVAQYLTRSTGWLGQANVNGSI